MSGATVLRCLTPTICSIRGRVVLEAGEKYSFNDDGSEMTIMEVTKLDEGDYTCIARNKAGESEQELSLTVFGEEERLCVESARLGGSDNEMIPCV